MYLASVYALVIFSVFAVMGFVYIALAAALWLAKALHRARAAMPAISAISGGLSRHRNSKTPIAA
jgi:hypothetical protein